MPPFGFESHGTRPVFRTAIKQTTFLGGTSMRMSQWEPLPSIGGGDGKNETDEQQSPTPKKSRREAMALSRSAVQADLERRQQERQEESQQSSQKLPKIGSPPGSWRPAAWAPGRQFGRAPFVGISDEGINRRVQNLEQGMRDAFEEAELYKGSVLLRDMEYRGFLLANRSELERELVNVKQEQQEREKRAKKKKPRRRMERISETGSTIKLPAIQMGGTASCPALLQGL